MSDFLKRQFKEETGLDAKDRLEAYLHWKLGNEVSKVNSKAAQYLTFLVDEEEDSDSGSSSGMEFLLTEERIKDACELLKPIIDKEGAARVGWVLDQLGATHTSSGRYYSTDVHKIAGAMCSTGEYKPYFFEKDCWIHPNHEYSLNKNIKLFNRVAIVVSVVTLLFILKSIMVSNNELEYHKKDYDLSVRDTQRQYEQRTIEKNNTLHIKDSTISVLIDSIQKNSSQKLSGKNTVGKAVKATTQ